jgi:uncharacterized protein (TIGR03435 family)
MRIAAIFCVIAVGALNALVFAVASIKPTDPSFTGKTIRVSRDNNSVTIRGWTLKELIRYSFSNGGYGSIMPQELVVGRPKWLDDDRYDITARAEGKPSQEERVQMLKALLGETCKLAYHYEPKETAVYLLVVGKSGPKMKERKPDDGGEPFMISRIPAGSRPRRDRKRPADHVRRTSGHRLKLQPAKAPVAFLIIDRIERPSEN